jgi:hypothetical protein
MVILEAFLLDLLFAIFLDSFNLLLHLLIFSCCLLAFLLNLVLFFLNIMARREDFVIFLFGDFLASGLLTLQTTIGLFECLLC